MVRAATSKRCPSSSVGLGATNTRAAHQGDFRRSGKEVFKSAKDGQKLKVGDTVQTDATGFAQVNYTDDGESFTRLDVNTTFTIESLTDEEGNRKIKGTVESGQTWNRTSALTENETFEQEGAGATAAVAGTAFLVSCVTATNCTFTSIVDGIQLTTVDGEVQLLDPLEQCDSAEIVTDDDADLCANVEHPRRDPRQRVDPRKPLPRRHGGLRGDHRRRGGRGHLAHPDRVDSRWWRRRGRAPAVYTPANGPPVIDANAVNIVTADGQTPGATTGPNTMVISQDEVRSVTFTLQVTDPEGDPYWIVFTALPNPSFGRLLLSSTPVVIGTNYNATDVFTFDPVQFEPTCNGTNVVMSDCFTNGTAEAQSSPDDLAQGGGAQPYPSTPFDNGDGTVRWQDSFTFKAVQQDTPSESAPATVTVEAVEDMCNPGNEGTRTANIVVSSCPRA
ncbi:MAG: hypothetical protein FJW86_00630 [Actinobacteria bacterium]|nr:hypothetical protein [Actinomycetota bacterium]